MRIALVNHCSNTEIAGAAGPAPVVSDALCGQLAESLDNYAEMVGTEHDIIATVRWAADGVLEAGEYELGLFDTSDTAGAAGYHDTDPTGRPYAKAFRNEATTFGGDPWSLTAIASHELAEMMRDPFAQWWVDRGAFEEALELCDRCEGYSFPLGGFEMADFLMAAALDPTATVGPWDYMLKLAGKEDVSPQGYVITRSSAFAPSVGAFLKASVRGGPQWRKRRWKTKTTVGRPGKRLGLYAKGKRCPVCFVPLSNADHAKRPCSVPGGPRMTAKGTAPTSRGPQDALSLVRKATTAAAQLARKVADPVIRRP